MALVHVIDTASGQIVAAYPVPPTEVISIEPGQEVVFVDVPYGDPNAPEVIIEVIDDQDVQVTTEDGTVLIEDLYKFLEDGEGVKLLFADTGQAYGVGPQALTVPEFASLDAFTATAAGGIAGGPGGGQTGTGGRGNDGRIDPPDLNLDHIRAVGIEGEIPRPEFDIETVILQEVPQEEVVIPLDLTPSTNMVWESALNGGGGGGGGGTPSTGERDGIFVVGASLTSLDGDTTNYEAMFAFSGGGSPGDGNTYMVLHLLDGSEVVINTFERGWYEDGGFHSTSNDNYFTGDLQTDGDRDSFFVFDLSGITQPIVSAELVINGAQYISGDSTETVTLYDFTSDATALVNGTGGNDAYNDLGTGTIYGSKEVSEADEGTFVTFNLNPDAIASMNAEIGFEGGGISGSSVTVTRTVETSLASGSVQYVFFTIDSDTNITITTDGPTIDPNMWLFVDDGDLTADDALAYDDDDGLPAGSFSNSIINSGDEIGILPAGSYVLAVGDYDLELGEAVDGVNDSSSIGIFTGDVDITIEVDTGTVTVADGGGSGDPGSDPTSDGEFASGVLDTGGGTITGISHPDGEPSTSGDNLILTGPYWVLTVNTLTGDYVFELLDNTLEHTGINLVGVSDQIFLEFAYSVETSLGQTASSTLTIGVKDDGPSIDGEGGAVSHDETPGDDLDADDTSDPLPADLDARLTALSVGSEIGHAHSAGGQVTWVTGADGLGNLALTTSTGGAFNGEDSGLNRTSDDGDILLYTDAEDDNLVLGMVGSDIVFAIYLDEADGSLWLVQYDAIEHPVAGDDTFGEHDDSVSITDLIYATITDGELENGDSATTALALDISFQDDGPDAEAVGIEFGSLVHDESDGVQPDADDPDFANDQPNVDLPGIFVGGGGLIGWAQTDLFVDDSGAGVYGTDGEAAGGGLSLALTQGDGSGFTDGGVGTETNLSATAGGTIFLFDGPGGVIQGWTTTGDSGAEADQLLLVFELYADDSTEPPTLSVAQYEAIAHDVDGSSAAAHDDPISLLASDEESALVHLEVTVEDGDGDTDSTYLAFGEGGIVFDDDGPEVDILPAVADASPTTDSVAEGGSPLAGTWTHDSGTDEDGAMVEVTVGGSTLLLNMSDTNNTVVFTDITNGGGDVLGTLTVQADGTWSFTPDANVDQGDIFDDSFDFTVRVTDGDGDYIEDTHTITVVDGNEPTAENVTVIHDESPGVQPSAGDLDAADDNAAVPATTAAALLAFFGVGNVPDEIGSATNDLSFLGNGDPVTAVTFNGVSTGDPTGLTTTAGDPIFYYVVSSTFVLGVTDFSSEGDAQDTAVFALHIDSDLTTFGAETGTITVVQFDAIQHNLAGTDHDDDVSLTIGYEVDDGDPGTATANITVVFDDDGPDASALVLTFGDVTHDETSGVQAADGADDQVAALPGVFDGTGVIGWATSTITVDDSAAAVYGQDGAGSVSLTGLVTSSGGTFTNGGFGTETNLTMTSSGLKVFLFEGTGGVIQGYTTTGDSGAEGDKVDLVLELYVDDATDELQIAQYEAVVHPDDMDANEPISLLSSGDAAVVYVQATVTDGDNDTDTTLLALGAGDIVILDDGPDASALVLTFGDVTHDETSGVQAADGADDQAGPLPGVFDGTGLIGWAKGAVTVDDSASAVYGQDGAGSVSLKGLVTSSGGTFTNAGFGTETNLTMTSSGLKVFLFEGANGVIQGYTTTGDSGAEADKLDLVLELYVDDTTDELQIAQYEAVVHPVDTDPNDPISLLAADGSTALVYVEAEVTDGDGDTDTTLLALGDGDIVILDDAPSQLSPDDAVILNVADGDTTPDQTATESLNFLAGADGTGGFIFLGQNEGSDDPDTDGDQAVSKDGDLLSSNGSAILLYGFGTDMLFATTTNDPDYLTNHPDPANDDPGLVYTVTLNPDGTYTVNLFDIIDGGQTVTFENLTGTGPAGNVTFKIIEDVETGTEILVTPLGAASTVNSDSDDIGVDNQWIEENQGIRIDIGQISFINGDTDYQIDSHLEVNQFEFSLPQVHGNGTASIRVQIFNADEDHDLTEDPKVPLLVGMISVYDPGAAAYVIQDGVILDPGSYPDVAIYQDGQDVILVGLEDTWSVEIDSPALFDRVEVEDARDYDPGDGAVGGDHFSVGGISLSGGAEGDEIILNYNVEGTDGDGDAIDGEFDIVLAPNAGVSQIGTDAGETLTGDGGVDSLYGLDGVDTLIGNAGNDFLDGGQGSDILWGDDTAQVGPAGADTFRWASVNDIDSNFDGSVDHVDTVKDYSGAGDGDVLDISDLLTELGVTDLAGLPAVFQTVQNGANAELQLDLGSGFQTFAIVENTLLADLTIDDGGLV